MNCLHYQAVGFTVRVENFDLMFHCAYGDFILYVLMKKTLRFFIFVKIFLNCVIVHAGEVRPACGSTH